jgi:hypothetical protein
VHGLAYVAALLLAGVFALAAVHKLADRPGSERGFRALGLPGALALVVPAVELLAAAALVVVPGWGAALALPLLVVFTAFLVRAVRRGVTAPCNCFGSARRAPVSRVEVTRNLALLVTAAVALTTDRPSVPGAGAVVLVAVLTGAVAIAIRLASREGPRLRRPAPPLDGAGWPAIVAFVSPGCPRCELDRPVLEAHRAHVVTLSPETATTFRAWRVQATPYYVRVDEAGVVRQRTAELAALATVQT